MGGEPLFLALWVSCGAGYVASALLCFRPANRPASLSTLVVATLAGLAAMPGAPGGHMLAYFGLGAGAAFPLCALHNRLRTLIRRRFLPASYGRYPRPPADTNLLVTPADRKP
jgi:hypothetical protein